MNFIKNLFLSIARFLGLQKQTQTTQMHSPVSSIRQNQHQSEKQLQHSLKIQEPMPQSRALIQITANPELASQSDQQRYDAFWSWFSGRHQYYYDMLDRLGYSNGQELSDVLNRLNPQGDYHILVTAMMNEDDTVELIFTADGDVAYFQEIEALVSAAPDLAKWTFLALKPAVALDVIRCQWENYIFDQHHLSFYLQPNLICPLNINIVVCHAAYQPAFRDQFLYEIQSFLQYALGESFFADIVDTIDVAAYAQLNWVKIEDIKLYLEAEQEKKHQLEKPIMIPEKQYQYGGFEGETDQNQKIIYFFNTSLLQWEHNCTFPWVIIIELKYQALSKGLPSEIDMCLMDEIEEILWDRLPSEKGYLHLAHETGVGSRWMYLACQDFRLPSRVIRDIKKNYSKSFQIEVFYQRDKYWTCLDHFD